MKHFESRIFALILLSIAVISDHLYSSPFNNSHNTDKIKGPLPGMEFVLIPSGDFIMGSPPDEEHRYLNENPQHLVSIDSFYFMTTEVTQAHWMEVMGENPSLFKHPNHPVEGVSWYDVKEFIKRLNDRYPTYQFRLPSESEWEYACRADTKTPFHTGPTINTDQANFDGTHAYGKGWRGVSRGSTLPVKSFLPNAWGLYDVHGNVSGNGWKTAIIPVMMERRATIVHGSIRRANTEFCGEVHGTIMPEIADRLIAGG